MRRLLSTPASGFGERTPCWSAQVKARLTAMTACRRPPFHAGWASSQRVTWNGFRSAAGLPAVARRRSAAGSACSWRSVSGSWCFSEWSRNRSQTWATSDLVRLGQVGRVGRHQPVEGVEDRLAGVPAGLGLLGGRVPSGCSPRRTCLPSMFDVPGDLGRAEPGLRLYASSKPPVETRVSRKACSWPPVRCNGPGVFRLPCPIPCPESVRGRCADLAKALFSRRFLQVGLTGFEPATSWSRTKRSSQAELQPVRHRVGVYSPRPELSTSTPSEGCTV